MLHYNVNFREEDNAIYGFFDKYRPFSNFHEEKFVLWGIEWQSGEHAFQAVKTLKPMWNFRIQAAETPSKAKQLGRRCPIRDDWEEVKLGIMYEIVSAKFSQSEELKELLLSTGEKYLEETNNWGDDFWGKDIKKGGLNHLGEILMRVRSELREGEQIGI